MVSRINDGTVGTKAVSGTKTGRGLGITDMSVTSHYCQW